MKPVLALFVCLLLPVPGGAEITITRDAQSGLLGWEWREEGISIQLVQRLPDQTRAFFEARGFDGTTAEDIAVACVFQTIFRNDGRQAVSYDLQQWRIENHGRSLYLLTREYWEEKWRDRAVSKAARIALNWALLPTLQRFEPGDYNWGMTSFGLAPGQGFDLDLVLTVGGEELTRTVPGIVCAADSPGV